MSQFYPLTIHSIKKETEQAVCLTFDLSADQKKIFTFKHGQYLTLKASIEGEECRRSYSICSSVDEALRVAIKKVDKGVFSHWANTQLKQGDVIEVAPPDGKFTNTLNPDKKKVYLCIAAGSGITPVLSVVKTLLSQEPLCHLILLYGNQRVGTMMFKDELLALKNRYLSRFQLMTFFTKEDQDIDILNGRITNKKGAQLCQRLLDLTVIDEYFLCGPESMISEVSRGLTAQGIEQSCIHYELFASSAEDAQTVVTKHHQRSQQRGGQVSQLTVVLDGHKSHFDLAVDGENILDAALTHGMDVPYSCKGGVCATCKAKVLSGEVEMDLNHVLSKEDLAAGYVLSCQSHPISSQLVIDFDQGKM
ncbi:MAG: 2Fe-2S iron-sulfur cluster binding domain-containing protein [Spongiibacteraceae bacterium]|nr:2Fe-2S iron-sulfur cluster binding domain-containing protein [Spongiibacteraceae bacterium]